MVMTRISPHASAARTFGLEASETLAAVGAARARFGVHRPCALDTGTVSRALRLAA